MIQFIKNEVIQVDYIQIYCNQFVSTHSKVPSVLPFNISATSCTVNMFSFSRRWSANSYSFTSIGPPNNWGNSSSLYLEKERKNHLLIMKIFLFCKRFHPHPNSGVKHLDNNVFVMGTPFPSLHCCSERASMILRLSSESSPK
jgi:hypothetical protein